MPTFAHGAKNDRPGRRNLEVPHGMHHVVALDVQVEQGLVQELGTALDARVAEAAAQLVDGLVLSFLYIFRNTGADMLRQKNFIKTVQCCVDCGYPSAWKCVWLL